MHRIFLLLTILLTSSPSFLSAGDLVAAKGVFLVATEQLQHSSFKNTVILLVQADVNGAMGLAINRPTNRSLGEFFTGLNDTAGKQPLFLGGPVHPQALFVAASPSPDIGWISVLDDLGIGSGASAQQLLQLKQPAAVQLRAYAGYCGWSPGQLEAEIERGDWRIVAGNPAIVFSNSPDLVHEKLLKIPTGHWI